MRITFVNVGYGDAILMESDTGYTALLDGKLHTLRSKPFHHTPS